MAATAGLAFAATTPFGFVSGQVVSVKGDTFVVKSAFGSTGDATVSLTGSSAIIEQLAGTSSDLKLGTCVTANGQKQSDGAVAAMRITTSAAVKGTCSTGFTGGHSGSHTGKPPSGTSSSASTTGGGSHLTGFPGFANFGFAAGAITALKGSKLSVHGESGSTTVTLSKSTQIIDMRTVARSAVTVDICAFVRGMSTDNGLRIKATDVNLSKPETNGCTPSFGGRPF